MNLYLISPELSLCAVALAVILIDLFTEKKGILTFISVAGLIIPLAFTISLWGRQETAFNGMLVVDQFSLFFKVLFIGIAAMVITASSDYLVGIRRFCGEYLALILLSALGLMLMASTRDLIPMYMSLELSSMSLYALVSFSKDNKSTEAGIKYFLLGAIASAVLLFGIAMIFGMTGTTNLSGIQAAITNNGLREPALLLGMGLLIGGFGFKIAAVPFHMWVPDVYQGAPTPVTAYLSVASKAAGFAVILRVFYTAFGSPAWVVNDWTLIFGILAAITMTVGNVVALWQNDIKRLLAYSGIAQAGYLMVGLIAANTIMGNDVDQSAGPAGIMFFLVSYALANLGAFITILVVTNKTGNYQLSQFSGMIKRSPYLAIVMAICLISLAGIPPTAGFIGKLLVFRAAADVGMLWLVIIAVVNSVIAAFYYFRIIRYMFIGEPSSDEKLEISMPPRFTLAISTVGVLVLGIYPYLLLKYAELAGNVLP